MKAVACVTWKVNFNVQKLKILEMQSISKDFQRAER